MRRVVVYRDGNQMAAQIGPDWVQGIAGFGDTVADAVRDLAYLFAKHRYYTSCCAAIQSASKWPAHSLKVTAIPGAWPVQFAALTHTRLSAALGAVSWAVSYEKPSSREVSILK